MPPKTKVTKEDIINAAVDIVRNQGALAINARAIAATLNCSTQPVFSNFATMEALRCAVINVADAYYQEYTKREIESKKHPVYKASGMAYIHFAKDEKELFKLLFMRDRTNETIPAFPRSISDMVKSSTGLSEKSAELFHLEMWAYVHGIAAMMATKYLELDMELVGEILTDAYQGMKMRYEVKE